MDNTDKTKTWMTIIGTVVAALVPLLVAYGILDAEKGNLWKEFILAVAAAIVPVVVGSLIKNFNDNTTAERVIFLEVEGARLNLERALLERE